MTKFWFQMHDYNSERLAILQIRNEQLMSQQYQEMVICNNEIAQVKCNITKKRTQCQSNMIKLYLGNDYGNKRLLVLKLGNKMLLN